MCYLICGKLLFKHYSFFFYLCKNCIRYNDCHIDFICIHIDKTAKYIYESIWLASSEKVELWSILPYIKKDSGDTTVEMLLEWLIIFSNIEIYLVEYVSIT